MSKASSIINDQSYKNYYQNILAIHVVKLNINSSENIGA